MRRLSSVCTSLRLTQAKLGGGEEGATSTSEALWLRAISLISRDSSNSPAPSRTNTSPRSLISFTLKPLAAMCEAYCSDSVAPPAGGGGLWWVPCPPRGRREGGPPACSPRAAPGRGGAQRRRAAPPAPWAPHA